MNPQKNKEYVIFRYAINKKYVITIIFMTSYISKNNKSMKFSNTQLAKNMISHFCIMY